MPVFWFCRHAKGRKTGVRFDKGTKESDITFDTYWEESQKKLSESWVLKMPRWQVRTFIS